MITHCVTDRGMLVAGAIRSLPMQASDQARLPAEFRNQFALAVKKAA